MCQACRNKALDLGLLYDQTVGVDDIIAKAVGSSYPSRMAAKEVAFRRYLKAKWDSLVPKAVRAGEQAARSGKKPEQIAEAVGQVMREWEADVKAKMKDFVLEMYWLAREAGWKQGTRQVKGRLAYSVPAEKAFIQKAKRKVEVIPTWNVNDRDTTDALQKHQLFWIGDHYDDKVSNSIADRAREKLIEEHLRPSEAGKAIAETVREELSWVTTPDGYRGSTEQYFEALTANAATTARAFGQVNSFEELGITKIEIFNPDDERTCEVCSWMNGKVFTVEQARGIMDAELDAKSPDAVRNAHPWVSDSTGGLDWLKEHSAGAGLQGPGDAAGLSGEGIVLPPFHFQCRCSVEVSEEAGSFLSVPDSGPEAKPKPEPAPRPPKIPKPPKQAEPTGARPESFPEIPDGPAKPMALFNKNRANDAIKDMDFESKRTRLSKESQKILRQEFNSICAEQGMVTTDVERKGGLQEILELKIMRGKKAGTWGLHQTDDGLITLNRNVARDLKVGLRRLAEGEEITEQAKRGLETMIHETIHGHSPLAGWSPGQGSAYSGIGVAVEEATTQAATKRIMFKKFGIDYKSTGCMYDSPEFIGKFKQAIEESVLQAAQETFGTQELGLSRTAEFMAKWEDWKNAQALKSGDGVLDMLGDAGIKMRQTKVFVNRPDDLLKGMAESFELPSELTTGLNKEFAENIAADFMNAMEKNGKKAAEDAVKWLDEVKKKARRRKDFWGVC